MVTAGTLRACWPLGSAFVGPGLAGLVLVMGIEFALITCVGVFNPVFATYRLDQVAGDRFARTLSAWSVTGKAITAVMTALWGLLAGVTTPRTAVAIAGLLLLATPLLLPRAAGPATAPPATAPPATRPPTAATRPPTASPRRPRRRPCDAGPVLRAGPLTGPRRG